MDQPSEPELSFVSTEALVTELLGRMDHGIVALMQIVKEHDDLGECRVVRRWKGNLMTCVGLATLTSHGILQHWKATEVPGESDDF